MKAFFDRIKEFIGDLWGQTTTQALAFLAMIQPVLLQIDPSLLADYPKLRWAIFLVTLTIAALRLFAPPPPAVPIKTDDEVSVDHETGTTIITKADATVPAGIVDKPAGVTIAEAREKV